MQQGNDVMLFCQICDGDSSALAVVESTGASRRRRRVSSLGDKAHSERDWNFQKRETNHSHEILNLDLYIRDGSGKVQMNWRAGRTVIQRGISFHLGLRPS